MYVIDPHRYLHYIIYSWGNTFRAWYVFMFLFLLFYCYFFYIVVFVMQTFRCVSAKRGAHQSRGYGGPQLYSFQSTKP